MRLDRLAAASGWRESSGLNGNVRLSRTFKRSNYSDQSTDSEVNCVDISIQTKNEENQQSQLEQVAQEFFEQLVDGIDDEYALPLNEHMKCQRLKQFEQSAMETIETTNRIKSLKLDNLPKMESQRE